MWCFTVAAQITTVRLKVSSAQAKNVQLPYLVNLKISIYIIVVYEQTDGRLSLAGLMSLSYDYKLCEGALCVCSPVG